MLLIQKIRVFVAVAEEGSLTAAAEVLNMNKSSVTEHLKQLEETLQVRLLNRTTRKQVLTKVGAQFYSRCRELQNLSAVALEEINEQLAEPTGKIRITAPHAITRSIVVPMVAKLQQRFPKVLPELIVTDKRIDLLEERIDLSITVGDMPDSGHISRRITTFKETLFASPEFLTKIQSDSFTDDAVPSFELPYIAQEWEGRVVSADFISKKTNKKCQFKFRVVAQVNSIQAALELVKNGVGCALLPYFFAADELERNEIIDLIPTFESRKVPIYAIHPFGKLPPVIVSYFIELLASNSYR